MSDNVSTELCIFFLFPIRNNNFYGKDTIRVTTVNRNCKNNVDFPIFVEPINDPPYINVPPFIVLEDSRNDVLIYNAQKDKFDFFIGDPDLLYFPGMIYAMENRFF